MRWIKHNIVPILFCVVISAVLPIDLVFLKMHGPPPGREVNPTTKFPDFEMTSLWEGHYLHNIERSLINDSFFKHGRVLAYNEWTHKHLQRVSNPKLVAGKDDWVFVKSKVMQRDDAYYRAIEDVLIAKFTEVNKSISRSGSHLLVTIIPDRDRVYPELAYREGVLPASKERFKRRLVERLEKAGVDVLFMDRGFLEAKDQVDGLFFKREHHWTYEAAHIAARLIARHTQQIPGLRSRMAESSFGKRRFRVSWKKKKRVLGMFVKKMGFRKDEKYEQSLKETIRVPGFSNSTVGKKKYKRDKPCAAYITTSMGKFKTSKFLENEFRCPVNNYFVPKRGIIPPISLYISRDLNLRNSQGRHHTPLVIWEIPELFMYDGYWTTSTIALFGWDIPKYRPAETFKTVKFNIGELRGVEKNVGDNSLVSRTSNFSFRVFLDEPASEMRLVIRGEKSNRKVSLFARCRPNNRLFYVSNVGKGASSYDFECENARRSFDIEATGFAPGNSFTIKSVMVPARGL